MSAIQNNPNFFTLGLSLKGIKVQRSDLVGLVMRRNELASEILKASTTQNVPPMLQVSVLFTSTTEVAYKLCYFS